MENSILDNRTLFNLNLILEQVIDYSNQHPNFLDTPGIFREIGDPLAIANALVEISNDPAKFPITSLSEDFLSNPHHITSIYKYFLNTITDPFTLNNHANILLASFITKVIMYEQLSSDEQQVLTFSDLIKALIHQKASNEAKFIHNHLHLCQLIAQHSNNNKINLKNAVLILCGSDFQDYVFGKTSDEHSLITNLNLQKIIINTIQSSNNVDYSVCFEKAFPEVLFEQENEKLSTESESPIEENVAPNSMKSMISAHGGKIGGFFKELKDMTEKTISDFTKKTNSTNTLGQSGTKDNKKSVKAKDLEAYKKQALDALMNTKKAFKEIVALSLDKDIPMDFNEEKVEDLLTFSLFLSKIESMKTHLNDYILASENDDKNNMNICKAICKKDREEVDRLIRDIEKEFNLIYKGFQSGEPIDALSTHLKEVMERKWNPLANLKEIDEYELISSHDDFDVKFERILSLHVGIEQALQSMSDSN